jgi:hypothetical protein
MNQNELPPCLSLRDCKQVRPLAEAVTVFAEDLVNYHRAFWDSLSPDSSKISSGSREWYLCRSTGLRAFSNYEAKLRLKHFASQSALITGAEYCDSRIQELFYRFGWREALTALEGSPKWEKFLNWRKKTSPAFAKKLNLWCSRSNKTELARHAPDSRIRLYAMLYDRAVPVPLEFCSEDLAAHILTQIIGNQKWPGNNKTPNDENIRQWRKSLGLKLSKDVVAKFPHPRKAARLSLPIKENGIEIDRVAAKRIGLLSDFTKIKKA